MNPNVVEQLRSVVESSGVFDQLVGAGEADCVRWLVVHSVFVVATLVAARVFLRLARQRVEDEGDRKSLVLVTKLCVAVVVAVLALCMACEVVTLWQYHAYPKAMVLRDVLRRV